MGLSERQSHLLAAVFNRLRSASHKKPGIPENGAEIKFLQQMLGHEQIASTQVYGRVSIKKLKEAHTELHPAANLTPNSSQKKENDCKST